MARLAKEYQRQAVLEVLEELVRQKQVSMILPRTVLNEFNRSLSGVSKRVNDALTGSGMPKKNESFSNN
ncbi:MAG: hypothetical protein ACXWXZ_12210 [Candidatus Binatia bacterium]